MIRKESKNKKTTSILIIIALFSVIICTPASATALSDYNTATTEDLLSDILNSDIILSLLITNTTYEEMYDHLRSIHTSLQELERRDDAVAVMVNALSQLDQSDYYTITGISILLSQEIFQNQISAEQERILMQAICDESLSNTTASVCLSLSSNNSLATSTRSHVLVEADVNEFTLDGDRIPLLTSLTEYTNVKISNQLALVMKEFPNLIVGDYPTQKYNCHSYAWYDDSIDNQYWLNDIDVYLNDIHSEEISDPSVGAKCVYYDSSGKPLHSAIITKIEGEYITCVSKWGANGLFVHEREYVPSGYKYNGINVRCKYYIYPENHDYVAYRYTSDAHTMDCSICHAIHTEPHSKYILKYTTTTHTYTCKKCTYTSTVAHTFDPLTNICTACNYNSTNTPVQPFKESHEEKIS